MALDDLSTPSRNCLQRNHPSNTVRAAVRHREVQSRYWLFRRAKSHRRYRSIASSAGKMTGYSLSFIGVVLSSLLEPL